MCNERLSNLKTQRVELADKMEIMKRDQPQPLAIDLKKAHEYFNNLKSIYESGTNEQKRILFKTYIRRMELDPDSGQINVTFYPYYLQEEMKRGNNVPRFISCGAGDRT